MLAHLDHSDLKELTRKADELWALRPHHDLLAVIQHVETEEEPETIAGVGGRAARGGGSGPKRGNNKHKFSGRGRGGYKQQNKQPNQAGKPDQAGLFGQVCYIHLKYGSKAYSCVDSNTCAWSGNE